jgi:hypothetical protein
MEKIILSVIQSDIKLTAEKQFSFDRQTSHSILNPALKSPLGDRYLQRRN